LPGSVLSAGCSNWPRPLDPKSNRGRSFGWPRPCSKQAGDRQNAARAEYDRGAALVKCRPQIAPAASNCPGRPPQKLFKSITNLDDDFPVAVKHGIVHGLQCKKTPLSRRTTTASVTHATLAPMPKGQAYCASERLIGGYARPAPCSGHVILLTVILEPTRCWIRPTVRTLG
jgi:hypothetical protein